MYQPKYKKAVNSLMPFRCRKPYAPSGRCHAPLIGVLFAFGPLVLFMPQLRGTPIYSSKRSSMVSAGWVGFPENSFKFHQKKMSLPRTSAAISMPLEELTALWVLGVSREPGSAMCKAGDVQHRTGEAGFRCIRVDPRQLREALSLYRRNPVTSVVEWHPFSFPFFWWLPH